MPPPILVQHQNVIHNLIPYNHTVDYSFERWSNRLEGFIGWDAFSDSYSHEAIARGDLFQADGHNNDTATTSARFIATMAWGYGNVGYGAWRTCQAIQTPNYCQIIAEATNSILNGEIEQAYNGFNLNYCGPAFFTKYFYFTGRHLDRYPLILDSVIARRLRDTLNLDINRYAMIAVQNNGAIAVLRYIDGYMNYLEDMHKWAHDLGCEAGQIEMFLFTYA